MSSRTDRCNEDLKCSAPHACVLSGLSLTAEGYFAGVAHKGVQPQHMAPAGRPGAHAKVVLLTVALAKDLFVERTDRVQQLPTDVHAEADGRRHVDAGTGVDSGTQSVHSG